MEATHTHGRTMAPFPSCSIYLRIHVIPNRVIYIMSSTVKVYSWQRGEENSRKPGDGLFSNMLLCKVERLTLIKSKKHKATDSFPYKIHEAIYECGKIATYRTSSEGRAENVFGEACCRDREPQVVLSNPVCGRLTLSLTLRLALDRCAALS